MAIKNGRWDGQIWDTHLHLDRAGRFLDAAHDFVRAGGTHLCLVHKPGFTEKLPTTLDEVKSAYQDTIKIGEAVRRECGLDVRVILGPHPVVWEHQIHDIGIQAASDLHLASVELAIEYCLEGKSVAVGEVGRPHYPVTDEIWDAANIQLEEVMRMANQADIPIQLHVEDHGAQTNAELASLCDRAGLPRNHAIHHYAPANVAGEFTHGLSSSVSMGKDSISTLIETHANASASWTMETDYLDDPRRPGSVLGPKTVPKRTQSLVSSLLEQYDASDVEELLIKIHHLWPSELYGEL
jgi:TatD-related deoxyribonuclease